MSNWADDFNTYEDACRFYGCDSPATLKAEEDARIADMKEFNKNNPRVAFYIDTVLYLDRIKWEAENYIAGEYIANYGPF